MATNHFNHDSQASDRQLERLCKCYGTEVIANFMIDNPSIDLNTLELLAYAGIVDLADYRETA